MNAETKTQLESVRDFVDQKISESDSFDCSSCLTLSEFVGQLKKAILDADRGEKEFMTFEWGSAFPTGFDCYRGHYDAICMEYDGSHGKHMTAGDFLKICEDAIGSTVYAWKGGDHVISGSEDMYVACAGMTSNTRVLSVGPVGYSSVCIRTVQINE